MLSSCTSGSLEGPREMRSVQASFERLMQSINRLEGRVFVAVDQLESVTHGNPREQPTATSAPQSVDRSGPSVSPASCQLSIGIDDQVERIDQLACLLNRLCEALQV